MMVFIEHPDHGTHIVYTNAELEWHKARGWKVKPEPERKKPAPKPKE